MTEELKARLIRLAEKYEKADFVNSDPSQFLRWYKNTVDIEIGAFIAAMLAFGNRKQFIPKIREIFLLADKSGGIGTWLQNGVFEKDFCSADGNDYKKFYRFYSYEDMKALFRVFEKMLKEEGSFGECIEKRFLDKVEREKIEKRVKGDNVNAKLLMKVFADIFEGCAIVPKGENSANKRVHMFLRWMVRGESPVDLGLWKWYSAADLIIPLDTHVIQEAIKMELIDEKAGGTLKTAIKITEQLKLVWKEDPCKGDFALFGLGVDEDEK